VIYVRHIITSSFFTASPELAAAFRVTTTTSSIITLKWAEQFNGLTEITGARLEYTVVGSRNTPVAVEVGRYNGSLTGLTPFTFYNVSLSLRNRLGLSDPVFLVHQTDASEFCLLLM